MSCFPVYFDFKKDREPMNDSFARDFPFPAPVSWETIDSIRVSLDLFWAHIILVT